MLLQPGAVIEARYELVERIGRGAMGEVWSANDLDEPRAVAIKVLLEQLAAHRRAVPRFAREARAVGSINSRHVCRLLGTGTLQDGRLFLVLERLHGETLRDRLARLHWMDLDQAGPLMSQVWRGVIDAHRAGVLHRDLKPGNVFLHTEPGGAERAVILDFGVAKLQQPPDESALTHIDDALGAVGYVAPEQLLGASGVDTRADLYAVAAISFRALTGRMPFEAITNRMIAELKVHSPAPSLQQATSIAWPKVLEEFFVRGLARDPTERFATAQDALDAWQEALACIGAARDRATRRLPAHWV